MNQQYDNEMRGTISRNERKEQDSHPDIKGDCQIDGVQYWVSGWRKERKDGTGSFYSLSFKAKEQQKPAPQQRQQPQRQQAETDSDIPFNSYAPRKASYVV